VTGEGKALTVVALDIENVKRVRAVHIEPTADGLVVVSGRNAQGKSSVIDAIWLALQWKANAKDTPAPIRDGADEARVTVDLGDYKVTRRWRGDDTVLHVTSPEGARYPSPQALLDRLVGSLSFDPLAFAEQPAKDQRATLARVANIDIDAFDNERARLFEQRTVVGRDRDMLAGQVAGLPEPHATTPDEEISAADLAATYEQGMAAWAAHRTAVAEREAAEQTVNAAARRVEDLRATLAAAEQEWSDATAAYEALPEPTTDGLPDLQSVVDRMAGIDAVNAAVRVKRQRADVVARHEAKAREYADLTSEIRAIEERKATAIRNAAMPVPGLGFDATGVTYNGIPFAQASAAERLRVSVAIAMALNPTVRVIRITDGSLLDRDNMRVIEEMAVERGYQVWVERVEDAGEATVVIEDGAVVQ
jgi:phage shock protein A